VTRLTTIALIFVGISAAAWITSKSASFDVQPAGFGEFNWPNNGIKFAKSLPYNFGELKVTAEHRLVGKNLLVRDYEEAHTSEEWSSISVIIERLSASTDTLASTANLQKSSVEGMTEYEVLRSFSMSNFPKVVGLYHKFKVAKLGPTRIYQLWAFQTNGLKIMVVADVWNTEREAQAGVLEDLVTTKIFGNVTYSAWPPQGQIQ
jgi:hypothetical protein